MIDSKHGKDTTRIQRRTVACELRELADKIDQGGRMSVLDDLPLPPSISLKKTDVPPSIPLEKTDDQIEARTGELISRHLREIARRGLRTETLERVYAREGVTAEMQYQSQLVRSAATDLEEDKIDFDEVESIILSLCYALGFNLRRKRDFWSDDPDGYGRCAQQPS